MPSLSSFRASLLSISMACAPLLIPTAFAQAAEEASRFPGSIEGWVVDEDGRPVATATVVVLGADLRASTDAGGRFLLLNVPVGSYTLQVQAAGFVEAAVDLVEVIEGEVAEVALQLVALEIPLKEIVVTAKVSILRERPAAAVALDRKEISELPHFGDDLFRAIQVLPGVSSGDISARFAVRGGLYDETLVTLDGQELMEPFHLKDFTGVFSILDPEAIGGVELTPGGFTAQYGDRMTGVLDMATRSPTATRTSLGISLTTAWVNSLGVFAEGKGSWTASARRGYLDWIIKAVDDSSDPDEDAPAPEYWDAFAKLAYAPNPNNSFALSLLIADDTLLFEEEDDNEFIDVESGYGSKYVWLTHQGVVGSSSFVNTALYLGNITIDRNFLFVDDPFDEVSDDRFILQDIRDDQFFGLRQEWQHELWGNNYLKWGFDARSYEVAYDYEFDAIVQDPIDDPRFAPGERITSFHQPYEGEQYALFVTDRMRLTDHFTAELGVRWDRQTLLDDSQVSPRVNLLFNVSSKGVLRFGWGHFYQSQRPYELRVQFGETEFLPAQKAEQFTAGYETDLGGSHLLRVDAYLRQVSDPHPRWETIFSRFHPVPEAATDLAKLAPESVTAHGVEVYVASRRGGSFDWWASYAWTSIEDELHGEDTPRFLDQPNAVTASLSWHPGPRWSLTGVLHYHTGWPTTAISAHLVPDPDTGARLSYDIGPFYRERLPDYARLDVRASRTSRVGRKGELTFFIDVQNLTNRDNVSGIAVEDPDYSYNPDTGWEISFPEEHWLPIIPSFGVSYSF